MGRGITSASAMIAFPLWLTYYNSVEFHGWVVLQVKIRTGYNCSSEWAIIIRISSNPCLPAPHASHRICVVSAIATSVGGNMFVYSHDCVGGLNMNISFAIAEWIMFGLASATYIRRIALLC